MGCQVSQGNIRVQAGRPVWGAQHTTCIEVVADESGSLNNKFFTGQYIDAEGLVQPYYVWFNVGTNGVDPEEDGVGIEVTLAESAGQVAVANALVNALSANTNLHANRYGLEVVWQNKRIGAVDDIEDGETTDATGFEFNVIKKGSRLDIGLTDDFNISFAEELLDITASQTGPEVLARLRTGATAGPITIPMKESDVVKLREIISVGGETLTVDGNPVTGWGSSKQFTNVIPDARTLLIEPVGATDRSEDLVFWLAYPNINSINFSGSSERIVEVEFTIYKDKSRRLELDLFILGDYQGNLLRAGNPTV
jgi:hypothetical protein